MATTTKEPRACEWDRVMFTPARSTARYCSQRCRVAAHRAGAKGAPSVTPDGNATSSASDTPSVTHDGNATTPPLGPAPLREDGYEWAGVVRLYLQWLDVDRSTSAGKRQWSKIVQEHGDDLRMHLNDLLDLGARMAPLQVKADELDKVKPQLDDERARRVKAEADRDDWQRTASNLDSQNIKLKLEKLQGATLGLALDVWQRLAKMDALDLRNFAQVGLKMARKGEEANPAEQAARWVEQNKAAGKRAVAGAIEDAGPDEA